MLECCWRAAVLLERCTGNGMLVRGVCPLLHAPYVCGRWGVMRHVPRIDRKTFCCMMATSVITRARMKLISWQTRKVGIGQDTSLAFHLSRLGQRVFVLPYLVVLRVARDLAAGADDPCSPKLPPFPLSSVSGPVSLRQKTTRYGEYSPGIVRGVAFITPFEMNRYGSGETSAHLSDRHVMSARYRDIDIPVRQNPRFLADSVPRF